MAIRKIEAMHKEYGKQYGLTCSDCQHLSSYNQSRTWYKCEVYGNTRSESTDWAKRNVACGMFNRPFNPNKQKPLLEQIKRKERHRERDPIEGQIALEVK